MADSKRLTIVYEHPRWFTPLFRELERRDANFQKIDVSENTFDPSRLNADTDVVFNRISPSSWTRGRGHLITEAQSWLTGLDQRGIDVINGAETFALEISKAAQVELLDSVGARAPRTRVVRHLEELVAASSQLEFPLVVKPNVGGSGAGIRLFRDEEELTAAVAEKNLEQPLGDVLLLQEYHAPEGNSIVRIETLDARYLYAIRLHLGDDAGFDLCPADVCKTTSGVEITGPACAAGAEKRGLSVESFEPPAEVIATAERIAEKSRLDVGGIEYLRSSRDGELYFYDVNALSNFVSDPLRVIGFDPTERLVDSIEARLAVRESRLAGGAR